MAVRGIYNVGAEEVIEGLTVIGRAAPVRSAAVAASGRIGDDGAGRVHDAVALDADHRIPVGVAVAALGARRRRAAALPVGVDGAVDAVDADLVLLVVVFGARGRSLGVDDRRGSLLGRVDLRRDRNGLARPPGRHLPANAREALQPNRLLLPSPAGLARTIEGAEAGVDGALVRLRTELVRAGAAVAALPVRFVRIIPIDRRAVSRSTSSRGQTDAGTTYPLPFLLGPGLARIRGSAPPRLAFNLRVAAALSAAALRSLTGGAGTSSPPAVRPFADADDLDLDLGLGSASGSGSGSFGSAGFSSGGDSSVIWMAGVEACEGESDRDGGAEANRASCGGGRRRVTILLSFVVLADRRAVLRPEVRGDTLRVAADDDDIVEEGGVATKAREVFPTGGGRGRSRREPDRRRGSKSRKARCEPCSKLPEGSAGPTDRGEADDVCSLGRC